MRALRWSALVLLVAAGCGDREPPASASQLRRSVTPGVRMTMDALHELGGVPVGWQLALPPGDVAAGRQSFVDLGCHSCHKVAGEPFSATSGNGGVGPELTGMGSHHPSGYFAEAILNPDAILVEGPGYLGPDGRSVMPVYPDMTLAQLADVVTYLTSLTSGGDHAMHAGHAGHMMGGNAPPAAKERPTPPASTAAIFFVQTYDVQPGKLAAFEEWFQRDGAKKFLATDGLVSIDTYVDATRPGLTVTSVFGFRDDASLNAFMSTHDPSVMALGDQFDRFIGPHDHKVFRQPPVYRAPGLSAP